MSPSRCRTKSQSDRRPGLRKDRLILIATEGEQTEKQYLGAFPLEGLNVVVIEAQKGKSSPSHILENLEKEAKLRQIGGDDEVWLMLDVDHWARREHLSNLKRVVQDALKKGYRLAISNPCFECWLLLHFQEIDTAKRTTCRSLETQVRKHTPGHSKSKLKAEYYTPLRIQDAIGRAKAMDDKSAEPWPQQTGTRVYKTVESILKLIKANQ